METIRNQIDRPWFLTILAATGLCAVYLLGVSLADVGYLAYYPLMFAGLIFLPGHSRSGIHPPRFSANVAALLLAGGALVVYVYLIPTLGSPRDDLLAYSLSAGYPIGDLLLLAGIAKLLIGRGLGLGRGTLLVLASGLLVGLGADVVWGYQGIQGALQAGGLSDAGYMVSWILFAWASYLEFAHLQQERPEDAAAA